MKKFGKNKIKSGKFLALGLMLLILVGIFAPVNFSGIKKVQASPACWVKGSDGKWSLSYITQNNCTGENKSWGEKPPDVNSSKNLGDSLLKACNLITSPAECIAYFFYWIFVSIGAGILWLAANFFNAMVAITLDNKMISGANFISQAWSVTRDLSNIFFLIILLYVAVELILGLAHDAKKTIVSVVIMALLINFSMFFTKVVIDTSNVLAVIFYQKVNVNQKNPDGKERPYNASTTSPYDKDISGGFTQAFDVTKLIQAKDFQTKGGFSLPAVIIVSLMAGLIMLFAAYAFFIAGLAFLSRLIELWMLIIFSPFAFMSYALPYFSEIKYIGWKEWFHRVISASFMAPIFMFCMYFIFLLINAKMFDSIKNTSANQSGDVMHDIMVTILFLLIPGLVLMILLLKTASYAKSASGVLGEMIIKAGGVAAGLALGAATGGAAMLGRSTIGRAGAAMANSGWAKKWEARGWGGEYARRAASAIGSGSFDIKGIKGVQSLASAGGIKLGEAQKGGFEARRKEQVEKRQKRAQSLEVGEDEKLKQHLNIMENDFQGVLKANLHKIEELDQDIKDAKEINDPAKIKAALDAKKAFVNALSVNTIDNTGKSITTTVATLKKNIFDQKSDILTENKNRKWKYADTTQSKLGQVKSFVFSGGQHSFAGAREAANKIRMDAKVEEKH